MEQQLGSPQGGWTTVVRTGAVLVVITGVITVVVLGAVLVWGRGVVFFLHIIAHNYTV